MHSHMTKLIFNKRMIILRDSRSSILFIYSHINDNEEKEGEKENRLYINTKNPLDVSLEEKKMREPDAFKCVLQYTQGFFF